MIRRLRTPRGRHRGVYSPRESWTSPREPWVKRRYGNGWTETSDGMLHFTGEIAILSAGGLTTFPPLAKEEGWHDLGTLATVE
jgi:hypothetical protein